MKRIPGPVWLLAAGKVVLHLVTTRLSFHRDELYFISASKRLAPSYVDFQPMTPVLVRAVRFVFGESLWGIRLIPGLAGATLIVLAAMLARELGGERRAQIFAAFVVLVIPFFVGANSALNTVSLELPAWMLTALLLARVERTGDPRVWPWIGAAIGLAILVKFTVLGYLVGIPIAIVATPLRKHLRSPWLWLGGAIAIAIALPSLVWQFAHDLPVVEFVSHQSGGGKVLGLSGRLGFLASLLIFSGPIGLFVLVPGIKWLLRDERRRAIAIATFIPIVVFFVASGKGYYAGPAMAVMLTAGAVAVAQRRQRIPRVLVAGLIVNLLIGLPLLVPIVPVSWLQESKDLAQATELGERLGWDDLAAQVGRAVHDLPEEDQAKAVIVTDTYATPAAIEYYAARYDLPVAVSGHNSSYLWWPKIPADHVAITLGLDGAEVRHLYREAVRIDTVRNRFGVQNYEWGKPIWIARHPKVTVDELREALRNFTA
jgi:hypothetical protein